VALICVAALALGGLREWSSRQIGLSWTRPTLPFADAACNDSFDLADTVLVGLAGHRRRTPS
jgi:hypothetical protein